MRSYVPFEAVFGGRSAVPDGIVPRKLDDDADCAIPATGMLGRRLATPLLAGLSPRLHCTIIGIVPSRSLADEDFQWLLHRRVDVCLRFPASAGGL